VSDSSTHRASNASDSCVSLPPFSWASLVSNEVYWRFAIYVLWHRTGTYLVTTEVLFGSRIFIRQRFTAGPNHLASRLVRFGSNGINSRAIRYRPSEWWYRSHPGVFPSHMHPLTVPSLPEATTHNYQTKPGTRWTRTASGVLHLH
jgi:hypothetical protein